jgi:small ligand-binding sensory domain FIST
LDIVGTYGFRKPIQAGTSDYVIVGVMGMNPDKSLHLSHEAMDVGTEVSLIQLAVEKELVKKPAIVSVIARNRGKINKNNIAGGLLVYCSAPFMVAQGRGYDIQPTFPLLSQSLNGAPFTGFLAGGEIGHSPVGGNRMMALSAAVIVFGKN